MSERRKVPISLILGGLIGVAGLVFVGFKIADQWEQVKDRAAHANVGWLALALLLATAGMTTVFGSDLKNFSSEPSPTANLASNS